MSAGLRWRHNSVSCVFSGDIQLLADADPQDIYAGNFVYRGSNGWALTVFK